MKSLFKLFFIRMKLLFNFEKVIIETIEIFYNLSMLARREGLLKLEGEIKPLKKSNSLIAEGLDLVVSGVSAESIRQNFEVRRISNYFGIRRFLANSFIIISALLFSQKEPILLISFILTISGYSYMYYIKMEHYLILVQESLIALVAGENPKMLKLRNENFIKDIYGKETDRIV